MRALRRLLLEEDTKAWKLVRRLKEDEGGNVMVLYVAAALLLVGMIWALIGTGARMVQKETIQSSADAAAFSAAVIKAKGLNIIAFCNLVMALLLAIIMLLRLIKGALLILWGVTLASCFNIFGGQVLCAFAPTAGQLYNQYSQLLDQVEPRIMDAMKGLAKLERAVDKSFPALALVEAYRVGTHDHYKKNFGKGTLVTVAWPLPVGQDLRLPTKDGTWDDLCREAEKMFGEVLEIGLRKIGLPGFVAGIFRGAVTGLLGALRSVLCGSGGGGGGDRIEMVDTNEVKYACNECSGAERTKWVGDRIANDDTILARGEECNQSGFSAFYCNNSPNPGRVLCNGSFYINLQFVSCLKKVRKPVNLGSELSDKPTPLLLADDWKSRRNVRAFTLLTDSTMGERRQSVNLAAKQKAGAPMLNQLLGMAQAELYAHNGHEDLWHMNWRARLVRFTFGDTSGTDTGAAASEGVPAGGAAAISQQLQQFLLQDGAAVLADQFLLH
jgi:hypothetical protein